MSCWVVPTIAAEIWGVPVQQILDGMTSGQITSKSESGFTFVDVAPDSPKMGEPTPPTYTVVTREEIVALTDEDEESSDLDWRGVRHATQQMRRPPIAA